MVQANDNGTADHLWHFVPMGSNQYVIENLLTHQVLAYKMHPLQTVRELCSGLITAPMIIYGGSSLHPVVMSLFETSNSGRNLEILNADITTSGVVDQWAATGCICQEWQISQHRSCAYPNPGAVSGSGIHPHDPMMLKDPSNVVLVVRNPQYFGEINQPNIIYQQWAPD